MYYLSKWRLSSDGESEEVDLPEDTGYLVLAGPRDSEYALIECQMPLDGPCPPGVEKVSDELEDLLEAAYQYAPALALARDKVEQLKSVSKLALIEEITQALRYHLETQRFSPYFMAKALTTELGYKYAGTYYWIIGCNLLSTFSQVSWVSRDFFVYRDSIRHFDVEADFLKRRFQNTIVT